MLTELLFETPWWLPAAPIGAGIFVFMTGNNRQERRVMYAGILIALLGVAMGTVSYLVDTDREKMSYRTRAIVSAVDQQDWQKLQSLLDAKTTVYNLRGPAPIAAAAQLAAQGVQLGRVRIASMDVRQTDTVIMASIRILSDEYGRSSFSDWQFEYQNRGSGWELLDVQMLPGSGQDADALQNALSRFR